MPQAKAQAQELRGHVGALDEAKLRFKEAYGSWKDRKDGLGAQARAAAYRPQW
jgi:hypothetical protein